MAQETILNILYDEVEAPILWPPAAAAKSLQSCPTL